MNPFIRPWRNIFNFSGRATRTEYALFHLIPVVVLVLFSVVFAMLFDIGTGAVPVDGADQPASPLEGMLGLLFFGLYVVFVIGHIAISIRRLHDHGEGGIKYLLTFIPLAGIIFWAIMVFTKGDDFENEYGPDPRESDPDPGTDDLGQVFS
jgi:uncharacterized membrane protein YhaH (DUF805 family)